ncbi:MAG TPA: hypothetical protein VMF53_03150 [Alphaproteobacteria bacterium]|nr:hypothetical protein [Alphaproteobacteria bacterium]
MLPFRRYRLAQPGGDGRHPCLDGDGAYLGPGTALVERRAGADGRLRFAPRPEAMLDHVLGKGYGFEVDCGRIMGSLRTVARALDAGDVTLALIALVQAEIEPLPDAAAALRLENADIELRKMLAREARAVQAARKYSPDQPRVPAGNPDGGQWTGEGTSNATIEGSSPADDTRAARSKDGPYGEQSLNLYF